MKRIYLIIALVIAIGGGAFALFGGFLVWQVFGTKRVDILTVTSGADSIALAETVSYPNTAGFRRDAVIRFNNRVVSDSAAALPSFPLAPKMSAPWRVRKYPPRKLTTNGETVALESWNLYLAPGKFSADEYDRFVRCYEKNKPTLDKALLTSRSSNNLPFVQQAQHIDRIIHGDPITPREYTARTPRYEALLVPASAPEVMEVAPDGDWVITKKNNGGSESIAAGKSVLRAGRICLVVPAGFDNRTGKTAVGEKLSDTAYFRSFADSRNRSITADYGVLLSSATGTKTSAP
ncbi:MAG: hypothetical protein H7145_05490 [Akkermansiaceae bacterium]|nr:hypothetical protein [Armatimonadota bacterium]